MVFFFFFFAMWVQVKVMDINYAYTQDEIQVVLANGFIDTGRKNEKQVRGWCGLQGGTVLLRSLHIAVSRVARLF